MILEVSLRLFNQLGESNVTSVDIADELDISPGNLYYHFRGKEQIIAALVHQLASRINLLVKEGNNAEKTLVARWLGIYGLLEVAYSYRFFLRNIPDVVYNYPESGKTLVKVVGQLRENFLSLIVMLAEQNEITIATVQKNLMSKLVNSIMLVMIYWESFQGLVGRTFAETEYIQDASLQILSLFSPYLSDEQIRDIHQCHQQYLREKLVRNAL